MQESREKDSKSCSSSIILDGGYIVETTSFLYTCSRIQESIAATYLKLTQEDILAIQAVLDRACGPVGVVYGLERQMSGPHGKIMKYNLNQLNQSAHLEELCRRWEMVIGN